MNVLAVFCLFTTGINGGLRAQNPNFNFSQLNFLGWNPTQGQRGNCCVIPVTGGNSHTVITTPGNDPVLGTLLPRIPSGVSRVARLGSPGGGTLQGANGTFPLGWRMNYDITVDAVNPILHYQLAVVGDGTHACGEVAHTLPLNSIYRTRITDQNGNLLSSDECSEYEIQSCSGGAMSMNTGWNTSVYFPWASVGIDLSPYIGQTVNLEFTYYVCYYWGFHGNSYAYIAPDLITETDTVYFCKGANSVAVEGLPRFKTYAWSNGESTQNITIQNPVSGSVYMCTYGSFNGCTVTRRYVLLEDPLAAGFTVLPAGCNEMAFTDASYSPGVSIMQWQWVFGDSAMAPGDTGVVQNPSFVYSDTGSYTVRMVVQNASGCRDTAVRQIAVLWEGSGDFTVQNACVGAPALFTDASTGNMVSHVWDFGDGNTSPIENPTHVYADTGLYEVRLVTENTAGCTDTITKQVNIYAVPVAHFTADTSFCRSVSFLPNNISQGAVSYVWNFGDGNTSSVQSPHYDYGLPGNYTVTLVAENMWGCKDTAGWMMSVFDVPVANFTVPDSICGSQSIQPANTTAGATVYLWDFGDGTTQAGQNPQHGYSQSGNYEIMLVAQNAHGCADTLSQNIVVNEVPEALFFVGAEVCKNQVLHIQNMSTAGVGYLWDFGNGQTTFGYAPAYAFSENGQYTITLTVSNPYCSVLYSATVIVGNGPVANFTATPNVVWVGGSGVNFTFTGQDAQTFDWDFGNGATSQNENVNYTYTDAGVYSVTLVVEAFGCADTAYSQILVKVPLNVPNIFSPNGDGANETFKIEMVPGVESLEMTILNRWGTVVYNGDAGVQGWNGKYNEKNVPEGVYFYVVREKSVGQNHITEHKGTVTLVR